jgi:D-inositol-3-phosphate glycosyltransferase
MTNRPHILHLIDSTSTDGVMAVLDHIQTCPRMAQAARHSILEIGRGTPPPRIAADLIVSHLKITWRGLPGLILLRARHATTPLVHVEHRYTESYTAQNKPARSRFHALLRTAYALFDRVVAVSETQAGWIRDRSLASVGSVEVISPVVDLAPLRALGRPSHPMRTIGFIGELDRQHGVDLLIEAFVSLNRPDLRLNIWGEGKERPYLEALTGIESRIRFCGKATSVAEAMIDTDVIAVPSRWQADGLVALQACAAGRPVVTTGVDGLGDLMGETICTVANFAIDEWTVALDRTLEWSDPVSVTDTTCGAEAVFAARWDRLISGLLAETVEAEPILAG